METMIDAVMLKNVVGLGRMLGLPEADLWAAARTDPADAQDPDARIPFGPLVWIWDFFMARFPGMPLGLRIGQMMTYDHLGLCGQLIKTSPDVRTALERAIRFNRLMDPLLTLELEESGGVAHLRLDHLPAVRAQVEPIEMMLAAIVSNVRRMSGESGEEVLLATHFAHPQKHSTEAYASIFPGAVLFDQPGYGLTFESSVLDWPLPNADVGAGRYIERYAETLVQQRGLSADDSMERQVRQHLHEAIVEGGDLQQDAVAEALGVGKRTLQRRLRAEGPSFAEVLGDVRRIHALRLLRQQGLAIYEVAFLLGYQEATSFYRAFKRWTGQTPEAFRRETDLVLAAA